MNDIAEGADIAAEGALVGRAVEPRRGNAAARSDAIVGDDARWLNCGHEASGCYCPQCGQKRHVHRTLTAIGHDLVHAVLHLDGKLFKTLPLLAFSPGELTRRYIEG